MGEENEAKAETRDCREELINNICMCLMTYDVDMAIAALKKQVPMEVAEIHCDEYYCPSCGSENMADCYKVGDNYCPRCGQALKAEERRK